MTPSNNRKSGKIPSRPDWQGNTLACCPITGGTQRITTLRAARFYAADCTLLRYGLHAFTLRIARLHATDCTPSRCGLPALTLRIARLYAADCTLLRYGLHAFTLQKRSQVLWNQCFYLA